MNQTTPQQERTDAAAQALAEFARNAAIRAAREYLDHHGLEADSSALADRIAAEVRAAWAEAMDDAREALQCPNGEVMAQTTFGASMALAGIAAAKQVGKPKAPPTVYRYPCDREQWDAFLAAMHSGQRVEIDVQMFDYWLEILPPVIWRRAVRMADGSMRAIAFGVAEGYEPITGFWQEGGRYFCQRTALINRGS